MLVAGAAMGLEYGRRSWSLPCTLFLNKTADPLQLQAATPLSAMHVSGAGEASLSVLGGPEEGLAARTKKGRGEDQS